MQTEVQATIVWEYQANTYLAKCKVGIGENKLLDLQATYCRNMIEKICWMEIQAITQKKASCFWPFSHLHTAHGHNVMMAKIKWNFTKIMVWVDPNKV